MDVQGRRRPWWALALLAGAVVVVARIGAEDVPTGTGPSTDTAVVENRGEAAPVAPEPAPVDPAQAFAIDHVMAQAEVTAGLFMVVGTTSGPDGVPLLTLGGSVHDGNGWADELHAQFGPCGPGGGEAHASRAERLVPGSQALVVRCDEGEGRGTVYVFGAPPGSAPGVLLQISCGDTGYELRGSTLAITAEDEHGQPLPDIEFALDGPILDTAGRLPSWCDRLDD